MKKSALVTGGCGFVGSNMAARLVRDGWRVTVFDSLVRHGAAENLKWLQSQGGIQFIHGDVRNAHDVARVIASAKPSAIFHLAGQVAMTTSMENPRRDFETNVVGSINVLESVRQLKINPVIVYSSSNKVYGDLPELRLKEEKLRYSATSHPRGVDESAPLDFQTPYGCSKGAADQYMLDYARGYGLNTVVFRHSTIFGGRQFATFDQGWVGWFCQQALEVKKNPKRKRFTISGDGKQVRDLLFVDDAVECYLAAVKNVSVARGQAFNIGGGIANSCSLLELFELLEEFVGVKLNYRRLPWRHSDQKFFVADIRKAKRLLQWSPKLNKRRGVKRMLEWAAQMNG
ncbi:MAG: SDR family NAD(P)-dependent oxidoreductase [Verrucomicrobia bacterium]|nr:MAG: SDR family NAD(P)-dependent oxidoreductase [Verrucomicrobiota bacterium]